MLFAKDLTAFAYVVVKFDKRNLGVA